jgi:hypothetical protein
MSEAAEKRVAELERELRGVQEMLAFVLYEVAEPVTVSKTTMKTGLPDGASIRIDDHIEEDAFVFSLEVPVAEQ